MNETGKMNFVIKLLAKIRIQDEDSFRARFRAFCYLPIREYLICAKNLKNLSVEVVYIFVKRNY